MTAGDFRRFARQIWCVSCLTEVGGGSAGSLFAYMDKVLRYSAGIDPCPQCDRRTEPMSEIDYVNVLVEPIRAKVRAQCLGQRWQP